MGAAEGTALLPTSIYENTILTSDRASRVGSLPLTDPALTTDETETVEPLRAEESTQIHFSTWSFQHCHWYIRSLLESSAVHDWVNKSIERTCMSSELRGSPEP
ncbi:MAG: hypothetical protein FRX49_10703 [Trebouxia sp. A1-2]|nr:MAG: hypothetical protein FRX49_10703 [Trebouxia sp. A1-2]